MKKFGLVFLSIVLISCSDFKASNREKIKQEPAIGMETITLGAGCFWCVEAIFGSIDGVESATSGYAGGNVKNPSYKEVCTGKTGHAEVVQVVYNPEIVSLAKILEVFFQVHDPTTLNRQGNDIGTQYRSAIFYHNDGQKATATAILNKLDMSGIFDKKIVTEITRAENFYPAEDYHQDYYELNGEQPYCSAVVRPKVEKFKKAFADILKEH